MTFIPILTADASRSDRAIAALQQEHVGAKERSGAATEPRTIRRAEAAEKHGVGEAMPILQNWDDLAVASAGSDVSKRQLSGRGASLVRVAVKAGTRVGRHSHGHEQFVQVISGSDTLETVEGCQPFAAGSLFHFLADTWHAAAFETDTVLIETNLSAAS